jgi:uncharacterized damage-inducible protein DinB
MKLEKLAEYQIWANDVTRGLLGDLTEEESSREVIPPFGSIRRLLSHITLAIEYNIEQRVKKKEVDPYRLSEEISTMPKESLLARWRQMDGELLEFAKTEPGEEYAFSNFLGEGEIRVNHDDFFMQYVFHTIHHRAQIMSAMRALGKEGKTTDYLFYLSDISTQA